VPQRENHVTICDPGRALLLSGSNLYRAITWQIADAKAEFFVTISAGTGSPINGDKLVASRRFASHYQHTTLVFHSRVISACAGGLLAIMSKSASKNCRIREAFLAVCCTPPFSYPAHRQPPSTHEVSVSGINASTAGAGHAHTGGVRRRQSTRSQSLLLLLPTSVSLIS
jgi:hypothetical protein